MLLVQGKVTLSVNVVRLYKALGGGWEIAETSQPPQACLGAPGLTQEKP
jgi:hypothetical protein